MPGWFRNSALYVLSGLMLLFIIGPVLGLRETGQQIRSSKIHEEHERRQQRTRDLSEREAKRAQENLERAEKELFGRR